MKKLLTILSFLLLSVFSFGQCVQEDFVSFIDWTNFNTAADATHCAPNDECRALGTSDYLISPFVNYPTQLKFQQDASAGGNGQTATIDYKIGAGSWLPCASFVVSTTESYITVNLTNISGVDLSSYNNVYFRFNSTFNTWYLDDVEILCNASPPLCTNPAHMTGCLINSCNGSCSEGNNEILFFKTGSSPLIVNAANIKVYYESTPPATVNYTESFISNLTYVQGLNDSSDCGIIFYDALTIGTIPANSIFLITRQNPCYPYNLSDFCGQGNIYCLFTSDVSWNVGGNFSNGDIDGSLRYFRTNIGGCIIDYNYEPFLLIGSDGAAISFPETGGAASSYFNDGCVPPPFVLPIELISFNGVYKNNKIELSWQTASETNNNYFEIYKNYDFNFEKIGTVQGAGNSSTLRNYSFIDENTDDGYNYYMLSQTDYDGKTSQSEIISVNVNKNNINIYNDDENIIIQCDNEIYLVSVYDITGKEIYSTNKNKIDLNLFSKGIYLIKVVSGNEIIVKKLYK